MKKLYVCDFDGTIYKKDNKRQYDAVLEEFKRLKKEGNEVIVATGRPLHLLKPYFKDFDDTYFISCDGAIFSKGFEIILEFPIDKAELKKKAGKTTNSFFGYGQCITYYNCSDKSDAQKLAEFYRGHAVKINCVMEIDENLYKAGFIGKEEEYDFLDKCWSTYGVTEFVAKGVSKGECLKLAMKALGFTAEETVVVGDGMNDISMMEVADTSYAMMSASPKVKACATKITDNVLNVLRGEV